MNLYFIKKCKHEFFRGITLPYLRFRYIVYFPDYKNLAILICQGYLIDIKILKKINSES